MGITGVPDRLIRKIMFRVGVPHSMGDVRAFRELLARELQLEGRMKESERIRGASLTEISVAVAGLI